MISLHILPNMETMYHYNDTLRYINECELNILPLTLILSEKNINAKFIDIYNGNTKIGNIVFKVTGDSLHILRLYIYKKKRYNFKKVLNALYKLVSSLGLKTLVTNADKYTSSIYKKHNIGELI